MDWFLYDRGLRHERGKALSILVRVDFRMFLHHASLNLLTQTIFSKIPDREVQNCLPSSDFVFEGTYSELYFFRTFIYDSSTFC